MGSLISSCVKSSPPPPPPRHVPSPRAMSSGVRRPSQPAASASSPQPPPPQQPPSEQPAQSSDSALAHAIAESLADAQLREDEERATRHALAASAAEAQEAQAEEERAWRNRHLGGLTPEHAPVAASAPVWDATESALGTTQGTAAELPRLVPRVEPVVAQVHQHSLPSVVPGVVEQSQGAGGERERPGVEGAGQGARGGDEADGAPRESRVIGSSAASELSDGADSDPSVALALEESLRMYHQECNAASERAVSNMLEEMNTGAAEQIEMMARVAAERASRIGSEMRSEVEGQAASDEGPRREDSPRSPAASAVFPASFSTEDDQPLPDLPRSTSAPSSSIVVASQSSAVPSEVPDVAQTPQEEPSSTSAWDNLFATNTGGLFSMSDLQSALRASEASQVRERAEAEAAESARNIEEPSSLSEVEDLDGTNSSAHLESAQLQAEGEASIATAGEELELPDIAQMPQEEPSSIGPRESLLETSTGGLFDVADLRAGVIASEESEARARAEAEAAENARNIAELSSLSEMEGLFITNSNGHFETSQLRAAGEASLASAREEASAAESARNIATGEDLANLFIEFDRPQETRVCPICHDELKSGLKVLPCCSPLLHAACLKDWFGRRRTCPMCNHSFEGITDGRQLQLQLEERARAANGQ